MTVQCNNLIHYRNLNKLRGTKGTNDLLTYLLTEKHQARNSNINNESASALLHWVGTTYNRLVDSRRNCLLGAFTNPQRVTQSYRTGCIDRVSLHTGERWVIEARMEYSGPSSFASIQLTSVVNTSTIYRQTPSNRTELIVKNDYLHIASYRHWRRRLEASMSSVYLSITHFNYCNTVVPFIIEVTHAQETCTRHSHRIERS